MANQLISEAIKNFENSMLFELGREKIVRSAEQSISSQFYEPDIRPDKANIQLDWNKNGTKMVLRRLAILAISGINKPPDS